jgi:hypothetical protein
MCEIYEMIDYYLTIVFEFFFGKESEKYQEYTDDFRQDQVYPCKQSFSYPPP